MTQFEDLEYKTIKAMGTVQNSANKSADTLKKMNDVKFNTVGDAIRGVGRVILVEMLDPMQKKVLPFVNKMISQFKTNLPQIKQVASDAFGGMANFLVKMQPTIKNLWSALKPIAEVVGVAIYGAFKAMEAILPPITGALSFLIAKFTNMKGFVPIMSGILAAFVTFRMYLLAMRAPAMVIQTISVLTRAWAVAQMLLNTVLLANPIGLVIAGIAGLVAAFVVAYKRSETFRNVVNKALNGVKDGALFVLNWLKTNWKTILVVLTGPIGMAVALIVKHWSSIKSATITAFNSVIGFLKQWGPLLLAALAGPVGLAIYAVIKHWDQLKSATLTVLNFLKNLFISIFTAIKNVTVAIVSSYVNNLKNNFNILKNTTVAVLNFLKNFFVSAWTWIKNTTVAIVNSYISNLKNNWDILKNTTVAIYTAIKNFLVSLWNSTVSFLTKIASNIVNRFKSAWTQTLNNTKATFSALKNFFSSLWNSIASFVSKITTNIVNRYKAAWTQTLNNTRSIFNACKNFLTSIWNSIAKFLANSANSIKNNVVKSWNSLKTQTVQLFSNIKSSVSKIFDDIVSGAKKLPGRIGDGIKSMASGVKKGVTSFANTLVKAMGKGLNGTITGINWVLEKVGAPKIKKWEVPKYEKGTGNGKHPGGLAILGDGKEHELYRTPKGQVGLSPNTDTLMNLPKGTEVLSGKQTKQAFSTAGVPMYDGGSGVIGGIKKGAGWVADKGQEVYEHAKDKTVETAGKVKDLALDVWDYASDPAGLMKKVFAKFIPDLPKLKGAAVDMLKGGVKKAKDASVDFIKGKLDEFMPDFGDGGGSYTGIGGYYLNSPFRITTRFTPGGNPNDKVHKGGVHKGLDLAAPQGTAIKSLTDGIVKQVLIGSSTAGNGVRIQSGSDLLSYIHMMSAPSVKQGQKVKEGQVIGRVGSTGFSTGPHLDLKIKRNGSYINPLTYLQGKAGGGGGATGGNYAGKYASIIRSAAARFGVSPALVAGIIKQESKFNPNARSPVGATGLMQLMPATARSMGVKNPRDPQQNIMGGTKYISQMLRMFHNDTALGLAAYNAGPGNVKKYGGIPPFRETQNYVRIVMANARAFGAQFGGAKKYKNGTGLLGHLSGDAIMGDGGKREPFLLPNGLMGLSPAISTLFKDLPKGTVVWKSVEDFMGQLNNGASSILGSNMPSVDLSGISSAGVGSTTTNNYTLKDIQNALTVDVNVQMGDVIMDGRKVAQVTSPYIKKDLVNDIKRDSYKRGIK